jgi:glycerol-3-phosphate dehydrogenase
MIVPDNAHRAQMSLESGAEEHRRPYDIAIIGGGINGVGIARDAAGRGLKALLVEQHDLASHTSSASTKLVHGGLRYLEQYDFRLVRESLAERERLLASAPHIVSALRFVLPHDPAIRQAWLIRIGLFAYDRLANRRLLPKSHSVDLSRSPLGLALHGTFVKGFVYSDCRVDDSRLVTLSALDAAERGAQVLTRTKVVSAERQRGLWELMLRRDFSGSSIKVSAKAVVNAAGPWVSEVLGRLGRESSRKLRLVK